MGSFEDAGDDFGGDTGGFGDEDGDKPFDDEPFDAGVEADEDEDPEKYIQQLAGKLGTSLRKYNDERGQPDFDLEKYAINSVISASHTSEMDEEDQKDIIRKIKTSGAESDVDDSAEGLGDIKQDDEVDIDKDVEVDAEEDVFGDEEELEEGLWDNVHAKRERGESPSKPGDRDYPKKDAWEKAQKSESIYEGGTINEAEYQGKKVELNKPTSGDVKKYKVFVKNDKGNVVKVNFGDKNMEIRRDNDEARKSFRARHNCADKKDKTTAGYWSCKMWSNKKVSDIVGEGLNKSEKNSKFVENKSMKETILNRLHESIEIEPTVKPKVDPAVKPGIKESPRRKKIWETKPVIKPKPKMDIPNTDIQDDDEIGNFDCQFTPNDI